MSNLKGILLGACLLLTVGLFAQEPSDGKNFIGAKVLFIDHGNPNSVDADITNGLEVFYRRNINDYFSFGVPLRGGFMDVAESINNRNFFSIDGILRAQYYKPDARLVPYAFGGYGYFVESGGTSNAQIPVGLGTDIKIGQFSYLNIQAEYRVSPEPQRDNLVLGIGYAYKLGKTDFTDVKKDSDGDGIIDTEDACPQIAGTAEFNGCKDTDGDGIPDPQDICPNQIGTSQTGGCPDNDGDGIANQKDDCPDVAGTLSGCPDSDGDGVADKDDECPEVAGDMDNNGCPDTGAQDDDGDGVANEYDACPDVAGTAVGCPDQDGDGVPDSEDECPEVAGSTTNAGCPIGVDSDNDGVLDSADACPNEAGPVNGCPDSDGDGVADKDDACPGEKGTKANGCPEFEDSDGDGFPDEMDNCPNTAGPLNGCPDGDGDGVADKDDACPDEKGTQTNGCPEFVDSDGDGFPDQVDKCPDLAGTLYGCPDGDGDGVADGEDACPTVAGTLINKGCPKINAADEEVLTIAMRSVRFQSGNAILLEESNQILNQIAAIMERYPNYHLQISGHTDNEGSPATNQLLSEDRAKSCYNYLVGVGVVPGRMSFIGKGQEDPIADNKRTAGRQLNRRVEFKMFIPR
ncbi:MAG: hypothetical protein Sapg2KO_34980 [Saprospiraceae bacterium]